MFVHGLHSFSIHLCNSHGSLLHTLEDTSNDYISLLSAYDCVIIVLEHMVKHLLRLGSHKSDGLVHCSL